MKTGKRTLLVYGFVMLFIASSTAQNFTSARSEGLGGADLNLKDVWAVTANPAATAQLNSFQASATYKRSYLLKELDRQSAALVFPVAKLGVAGFAYTQHGYSLYKEQEACFTWSRDFAGKISAGMGMTWKSIHLGENYGSQTFYHFSAGIQAKLSNEILFAAVIEKPFNSAVKKSSFIKLGLQYAFSEKLSLHCSGLQQVSAPTLFAIGIEYVPYKNFFLRGGISADPLTAAFGFGWQIKKIRVDIAASHHSVLGFSPVISLSYGSFK